MALTVLMMMMMTAMMKTPMMSTSDSDDHDNYFKASNVHDNDGYENENSFNDKGW